MRTPSGILLWTLALALVAVTGVVVAGSGADGEAAEAGGPEEPAPSWEGLVGEPRAQVALGQRMLVLLNTPSLADRVTEAGGRASDAEMRRWTAAARREQELFISRMAVQGADVRPELSFVRVVNGFSAPLDPRAIALLERAQEVEGIYPVRPAYPTAVSGGLLDRVALRDLGGMRPDVGLPGFDGRGVTIALLDTGVDRGQPYLRGRVLPGIDIVGGSEGALAAPHPGNAVELERHGTQLAGLMVGSNGPGGMTGVAPGAAVLPIRVAGWQPDAAGGWTVYGRTDQLLAGLERAVDPNDDGNALDAVRIAVVGVSERYAGFADGPLARGAGGAMRLGTLVVAPAGNDGALGPGFGSIAGPGGAPTALTVGAADLRRDEQEARVVVRTGLHVVHDRVSPLAGVLAPERPLALPAAMPRLAVGDPDEQAAALTLGAFFDEGGYSVVAGRVAVVPGGEHAARNARWAARAGAAAVLLYGAGLPAGALGLDERTPVAVAGIPVDVARGVHAALRQGVSTGISLGRARVVSRPDELGVAAFSSRGLAFDGRVKPELAAPGVALATSDAGANEDGSPRFATVNGSSASAALVAGAAALVVQARPQLGAAALKSLLVGGAAPFPGASVVDQGAGLLDVGAAASGEVIVAPTSLAFGRATETDWSRTLAVTVRNVSSRALPLRVEVERHGFPAADTFVTAQPGRLVLQPGAAARVRVQARVPEHAPGGPPAEGALVVRPAGAGRAVRIPFAVAFAPEETPLLGEIALSDDEFEPSDENPAVLTVRAGSIRTVGGRDELEPVGRLEVELWTGAGRRIGVVARLRNLLPGNYAFGITGRGPGGDRLRPGAYRLRIVAVPPGGGPATVRVLEFRIT
jgi:subtilisin family serine protease